MSDRQRILNRLRELMREAEAIGGDVVEEMRSVLGRGESESGVSLHATPAPRPKAEVWRGIIGNSPGMLKLRDLVRKCAPAEVPVLLIGESGTGKDLVARAVHQESARCKENMISENCAAIPETLLESTLFGHKRGAFTGAVRDHPGHFASAHKGTLFLDEIGDMGLPMQAKLLRALQEGEVRPLGGSQVVKVDVRVIAATNQDLGEMVGAKTFREDLFYRLNVLRIELPPLRERGDDIELLATHFLDEASSGRELRLSDSACKTIASLPWPGNVRQLQNEMRRLAALCDGPVVEPADLSPELS